MVDRKMLWRRVLILSGLSALAVSGPLLEIYGRNPEVFVANRTSRWEIALFALLVVLLVPLLSFLAVSAAHWVGQRSGDAVYRILLVALSLGVGLVVSRQLPLDTVVGAIIVTLAIGSLILLGHRLASGYLALSALAIPVVLVIFLTVSPSASIVWSAPEPAPVTGTIGNPVPVVMIQLDEMPVASIMEPGGTINSRLFPNFARLAEEGTWYRNAISSSIATTQSIPAILTGRLGERGMSPSSVDHPENLFTLLGEDYEMHVIEWVADMCPEQTCPDYAGRAPARFSSLLADVGVVYLHLTMPAPIRESLPSIDNAWKGFLGQGEGHSGPPVDIDGVPVPDGRTRVAWASWIQRLADGIEPGAPKPVLSYAHLQAPHVPWETNPSGTHYLRPEEYTEVEGVGGDGRWSSDQRPGILAFQRHLLQVGFLDLMLGRLWESLDSTGSWDETMVVVIADHGASFVAGEHRRWPYENNRDDLYRVPMLIKYPGQTEGEIVDEPVYGIDLVPTVVDVLDVETDWQFDGVSLLDVEGTDRPHTPIWWCCSDEGISTDLAHLFDQVERNHRWVGDQTSWIGVAGAGAYDDLIGEPADSLVITADDDLTWSLDLGSSILDAGRDDGMVQTLLTGRVALPPDLDPDEIVVTVNGTVAGMGYVTRDSSEGATFRAVIAEELVTDGPNEVDLLVPGPAQSWLSGRVGDLSLELFTDDGRRLDLRQEASKRIEVEEVTMADGGWLVSGWSADVTAKTTAEMIYVFVGDRLVASGPPNQDNSNVVRWFGSDDLLRSGFELLVPVADIPSGVDQVLVVAEYGSHAVGDPAPLVR